MINVDLASGSDIELLAAMKMISGELHQRASGAKTRSPIQTSFLPDLSPIDPRDVDLEERRPNGKKRWLRAKEAAAERQCSADTMIRQAEKNGSGLQPGGEGTTWYIDMTRYEGRY